MAKQFRVKCGLTDFLSGINFTPCSLHDSIGPAENAALSRQSAAVVQEPGATKTMPMRKVLVTSAANRMVWQVLRLYVPVGTRLTNVYRSPQHQLDIIVERAKAKGYIFKRRPVVNDESTWLQAWKLVNTHSDPVARPGHSMHERWLAYDLAGPNLQKIMKGIKKAAADGRINLLPVRNGWTNPRLEGTCVHVEIEGAMIDFEPFEVG